MSHIARNLSLVMRNGLDDESKKIVGRIVLVFLIVLALLLLPILNLVLLTEHTETRRGTLTYLLKMHSVAIKNFPIIKPANEPRFISVMQEGNCPGVQSVIYESAEKQSALEPVIEVHMKQYGYSKLINEHSPTYKDDRGHRIEVSFGPAKTGTLWVQAEEMENFD